MEFHVYKTAQEACEAAAMIFAAQILRKSDSVLGLATGSTPIPCYEKLAQWYEQGMIDFSKIVTFNLDEYVGIDYKNPLSYHAFMDENLFSKVNVNKDNVHLPSGDTDEDGKAYDAAIKAAGGVDIQLLGIGRNGHIGFNEPGDKFVYGCHVVDLSESTIDANKRFFDSADDVPKQAVSLGIGSIMKAKTILLLATGEDKAEAVRAMVQDEINPQVQATILRTHPSVIVLLDAAAASKL